MTTYKKNGVFLIDDATGHIEGVKQPDGTESLFTYGGSSSFTDIITKQFDLTTGANNTYSLDSAAGFNYTINSVNIRTASGTITAAIKINGTNVTGLSAISVTSTPQDVAATAANTVVANDRVTVVFSSNSAATFIELTLNATRTS